MKLKKYELVRAIDKVKSVVQKNPQRPALGGVLIKEGYVIAANNEITIQVKVEGADEESFILPAKAFDLIKNLPEGEVEVKCDEKYVVTIQMEKIKNSYQSDLKCMLREINGQRRILMPLIIKGRAVLCTQSVKSVGRNLRIRKV